MKYARYGVMADGHKVYVAITHPVISLDLEQARKMWGELSEAIAEAQANETAEYDGYRAWLEYCWDKG